MIVCFSICGFKRLYITDWGHHISHYLEFVLLVDTELYRLRYSPTITPIILAYKLNKEKFVEILEKTRSPEIHHLSLSKWKLPKPISMHRTRLRIGADNPT